MKLKNLFITAVSTVAIGSSAFAAKAPTAPANAANATATLSDADLAAADAAATDYLAAPAASKAVKQKKFDKLVKAFDKILNKTPLNDGQYNKLLKLVAKVDSLKKPLTGSQLATLNAIIAQINSKSGKPPVSPVS